MSDSDIGSQPPTPVPEAGQDPEEQENPTPEEQDSPGAADSPKDDDDDDLSDNESELSEVDEGEFADFDPKTVALEDRPLVDIDEDVARSLKASKKKKTGESEGKKPKEGKRDKKKKRVHDEDEDPDGHQLDGKRVRKPKSVRIEGDRERVKERRAPTPENDENLTPEERRRRALDQAMDAALKNPNKRRRKKDEVVRSIFSSIVSILTLFRTSRKPLTKRLPSSRSEWSKHAKQIMRLGCRANPPFTSSRCYPKLSPFSTEIPSNTLSSTQIPTSYNQLNSSSNR
jgi:hypothetical protein